MKRIIFLMFFTFMMLSITAVSAEDSGILPNDDNSVGQVHEILSEEEILSDDSTDGGDSGDSTGGDGTGDSTGGDSTDGGDEVLDEKANSTIIASDVKGYESFTTTISIKLTANGTALSSKPVQITLNGVTYDKITDANGVVNLNVKLTKGVYLAEII